jgi:uncharacterized protein (UPF0548 family)
MMFFRRPTPEQITSFLKRQGSRGFSYDAVGATATNPPAGYSVRNERVQIGTGMAAFQAGVEALKQWRQFRIGWVEALPETTSIRVGESVAVIAKTFGIWSLNACRIVYVIDEQGPQKRFGFAYGTLEHMAKGEERFLIQMDADGNVWYEIYAFSRPSHPLTKLGSPVFRQIQRRFVRDSQRVMQEIGRGTSGNQ